MAETPRTSWTYLKGPWHSFELHLSSNGVELKEYSDPGKNPNVSHCKLSEFLNGSLHDEINASMKCQHIGEALESARKISK